MESAGLATADPGDQEVVRALYAEAVARWVDEGRTAHYVVVPGDTRAWLGPGSGCAEGRFTSIATDWRETNLLSSRAWRALGYQDSFWRLHRLVGH